MSGSWSGFSEDDIKKLTSNNRILEVEEKSRKMVKAKRRVDQRIVKENNLHNREIKESIPEDVKLSQNTEVLKKPEVSNQLVDSTPVQNETNENSNLETKSQNNFLTLNTCKIEKKVIDLEEFQARQKLVEEQNRRRKELLTKALADRTKQTEEEAKRLKEIQTEFKKLDAILSNDVGILRHQIELASLEFMEAQKKYNKIEKEYLDAKLVLHDRLEKKEMLTEHLCAIIEKNEERKAEKLNELMNRLITGDKAINDSSENCNTELSKINTKNSESNISENDI